MKTLIIWIVIAVALLWIMGKVGKADHDWAIVLLCANLFWWAAGALFFVRFCYRFLKRNAGG
jgi:hypothetical protein